MKIKAEWIQYLHRLREKELDLIFRKFPLDQIFETTLEIGAGDGFQSGMLSKYSRYLISTDCNPERLKRSSTENIEYRICDADIIDTYFRQKQFDLVFSSNLLEHLPYSGNTLRGIHKILKDDGLTVHVVPSQFWKFCQMLLFYPNLFLTKLEELSQENSLGNFIRSKLPKASKKKQIQRLSNRQIENNPKMVNQKNYSFLRRHFWPIPHGTNENNIKEFFAWRRKRWIKEFSQKGFKVIKIIKGPVCSGYGFGCDRIRAFLEKMSLSSEYIFVAEKRDRISKYRKYF